MSGIVHNGTLATRRLDEAALLVSYAVVPVVDGAVVEGEAGEREGSVGNRYRHEALVVAPFTENKAPSIAIPEPLVAQRDLRGRGIYSVC